MSAREEAREAAKLYFYDSARTVNPSPATAHVCNVAADAASDVWEPLLRDVMKPLYAAAVLAQGYGKAVLARQLQESYEKLSKALEVKA